MSAKQLVHAAIENQLFSDKLSGKTPHQTMKAKLSVDIRRKGNLSLFVRTRPGRFFLRSLLEHPSTAYEAKPLRAVPATENVLVFPSKWLDKHGRFQGINRSWKPILAKLTADSVLTHIGRIEAEQREDFKQVLTYVFVTRQSQILGFKRGTFNRVEDYLRGSYCIGFGGHVSELDRTSARLEHSMPNSTSGTPRSPGGWRKKRAQMNPGPLPHELADRLRSPTLPFMARQPRCNCSSPPPS